MNRALFSSVSSDWRTPPEVLELVRQVGLIAFDPCTTLDNPCGAAVICIAPGQDTRGEIHVGVDGLEADWVQAAAGGLVYVNPPYGRLIGEWILRCCALKLAGGEGIALLPARTDTSWWQKYCALPSADAVCFWEGRLTFVGAPAPAPFPSALVYWGERKFHFAAVFEKHGAIWL